MYVRRFIDRFDDNQITKPLTAVVGNGTIVEAGTDITLTAPNGVDNRWEAGVHSAPVAYVPSASAFPEDTLDPREHGDISLLYWETRMVDAFFTPVDDVPRSGLMVWWNFENAYQLSYDFSSEYVVFERITNDVVVAIGDSGGNTGNPGATPKILRIYYNPRSVIMRVHGQDIDVGSIAAFHSDDDGLTWSYIAQEAAAINPSQFGLGLFLKRSDATPLSTATSIFTHIAYGEAYLSLENTDEHDKATGVFEDRYDIPTAGGVDKHSDTLERGVGQYMPGPADQPADAPLGPDNVAAFEDGPLNIPTAGGPKQHQSPEMGTGTYVTHKEFDTLGTGQALSDDPRQPIEDTRRNFPKGYWEDDLTIHPPETGPKHHGVQSPVGTIITGDAPRHLDGGTVRFRQAYFEDRMFVQLGGPPMDYPADNLDGDGNNFVGGYQARYVVLYDPATDEFGATRSPGDGFYGADRSGVCYYDGTACAFGDFGTVAGGLRKTAWSATGDPPLEWAPATTDWTISVPVDGSVRFTSPTAIDSSATVASNLRWYVEGDFDVEVEYLNYAMTGGSDGGAYLGVRCGEGQYTYVRRRTPGSDRVDSDVRRDSAWVNYASVATSVITGKFRITRSGTTIRRYYDIGGGWVQIGTDQAFCDHRVLVYVGMSASGTATSLDVTFRNLTVNLGTVSNKIGWASEVFGADRGNRDDFPNHAIAVSTDTSVDIIDTDNDKLWMRFLKGTNNVLDDWAAAQRPQRLAMKNGVLLVPLSDDADTEGGLVRIDFNLGTINVHREEASAITGANYKQYHGGTDAGVRSAPSALQGRNTAEDWSGDYDTWKQQDYPTRCGDLWFSAGHEFRASANNGGLAIFKWHRWYLYGSTPLEALGNIQWAHDDTGEKLYWCHFRDSGEVMYLSDTSVHSVFLATYEPRLAGGFAGIFSPDQTKALPGTRSYDVQKVMVPYSTNRFYLPADEGVYQIEWPVGSFIHQFGPPGSGAAYEIVPTGAVVKDVTVADDVGTPVLVLTLHFKDSGDDRLMAINIVGNTVHSYTPIYTGNMQFAESAS